MKSQRRRKRSEKSIRKTSTTRRRQSRRRQSRRRQSPRRPRRQSSQRKYQGGNGLSAAELLRRYPSRQQQHLSPDQCAMIVNQVANCKTSDAFKMFASIEVNKEMGNVIIEYMAKKTASDKPFETAASQVDFHLESKLISKAAASHLAALVSEAKNRYDAFISQVKTKNSYPAKNQPHVTLDSPKKWAECIMELVNIVEIEFKQGFSKMLAGYVKENETVYNANRCMHKPLKECTPPCVVRGSIFKRVCSYVPPTKRYA